MTNKGLGVGGAQSSRCLLGKHQDQSLILGTCVKIWVQQHQLQPQYWCWELLRFSGELVYPNRISELQVQ